MCVMRLKKADFDVKLIKMPLHGYEKEQIKILKNQSNHIFQKDYISMFE